MNVLVTGGSSFISQFVAERFYKEGYQIVCITEITMPKSSKFKYYHLEDDFERYEWVFKSHKFDVVIHIENEKEKETHKSFNQFMNCINLALKYDVGQFVFVPIMQQKEENIYTFLKDTLIHNHLATPQTMGLGLTTIIAKHIYGPGARYEELDDAMSSYIKKAVSEKCKLFKPKQNTYYYVDDVVDAIYKVIQHKHIGVFELGKDIIQGWEPKYNLEMGLERMISWYQKNGDFGKIDVEVEKISLFKRLKVLLPYGENVLFFIITFLISYQTKDNTLRYNVFPLDFNLIYIFLISAVYGMRQGIVAIALACFSYVIVHLNISPDLAGIVYNQGHIIQLLIYIMVGIVTAYVIDNKRREVTNLKIELSAARDKQMFIEEVCNQVTEIKEELQEQILNTDNSLGKIYTLSQELNSLLVEDVYDGAVYTLEKLLKTQSVSIYKCNQNQMYLRLVACSRDVTHTSLNSIKIEENKALQKLVDTKDIFINYELKPDVPIMMAPILYREEIIAIVFVDQVPFESLTLYYENFFRVAIGLIQNALSQALTYELATAKVKYIGETAMIHMSYFEEIIKNKQRAEAQFNIPYTVLEVKGGKQPLMQMGIKIKECIRETDYIGANDTGQVYVLLSGSDLTHSQLIIERLRIKGIEAIPYKEVNA